MSPKDPYSDLLLKPAPTVLDIYKYGNLLSLWFPDNKQS